MNRKAPRNYNFTLRLEKPLVANSLLASREPTDAW